MLGSGRTDHPSRRLLVGPTGGRLVNRSGSSWTLQRLDSPILDCSAAPTRLSVPLWPPWLRPLSLTRSMNPRWRAASSRRRFAPTHPPGLHLITACHHRVRRAPPPGIPACAYTLDASSEDFTVDLRSSCHIVLPARTYVAAFSDRLTGCLDDHRISGLDSIRVRAFFRWWSITGTARPPLTLWHRAPQRRAQFVPAAR